MTENEIHFRDTYDCIKKIKSIRTMYRDTTPSYVALSDAIQSIEEIQQYRAIGTIEEFKDLKEKNTKKRFNIFESRGMRQFICGYCDRTILTTDNYCSFCGQKLDWQ